METISFSMTWKDEIYEVEAEIHRYREHYGADADGNRGIDRECYEINSQSVYKDVADEMVKVEDADIDKEFQKAIEDKIDNQVSNLE